jgi:hypothetical protein
MKYNRILVGFVVLSFALVMGCSDDETALKKEISIKGDFLKDYKKSLRSANLYLLEELVYEDHLLRTYALSDGTHVGGTEWDLENYQNATYVLGIQLGIPAGESWTAGNYPLVEVYETAEVDQNIAFIYYQARPDEQTSIDVNVTEDGSPVVVSGGLEDGEAMTVKFTGPLYRLVQVGEEHGDELCDVKISFRERVQDVREID